jgi:hypothetical protein
MCAEIYTVTTERGPCSVDNYVRLCIGSYGRARVFSGQLCALMYRQYGRVRAMFSGQLCAIMYRQLRQSKGRVQWTIMCADV